MPRAQGLPVAHIEMLAGRLTDALRVELQRNNVATRASWSSEHVLAVAGSAGLGHDTRVVGLYRLLAWIATIVLRPQPADPVPNYPRLNKKYREIAPTLRDAIHEVVKLTRPITELQEEMDRTVPLFAARPGHLKTCAKLGTAVRALVDLMGDFDDAFGRRPYTKREWGQWQIKAEALLQTQGFRAEEIAKFFGRSDAQAVSSAKYRRKKKAATGA